MSGVSHPPAGRRALGLIYVPECELCGGAHTHRAALPATSYTRSPSCRPSAEYEVVVGATDRTRTEPVA